MESKGLTRNEIQDILDEYGASPGAEMPDDLWDEMNTTHDVARTALRELERQGTLEFLLLKDPVVGSWWSKNK